MFLKICGITREEDAEHAVAQRRDGARLRLLAGAARATSRRTERRPSWRACLLLSATVGVFVNEPVARHSARRCEQSGVATVQLHGDEPVSYAARADAAAAARARRGRGHDDRVAARDDDSARRRRPRAAGRHRKAAWTGPRRRSVARTRRVVLAGGLSPENVEAAVGQVEPVGRGRVVGRRGGAGREGRGAGDRVPPARAPGVRALGR